ncbi:MAG: type II toxin-antitoxin system VapC family toxin [Deltaproteobacteria bacterium]|nr:type II toxin-antitoxin system VapC family toxin [Deltaproteobacteria bacterium]
MILLDTNVLSELVRARPDPAVAEWIAAKPISSLFTSAITQAEMLLGVALMPSGKRRAALTEAVSALFDEDMADRVLSFEASAARDFAAIVAHRRTIGRPISHADAQIAAIARSRGATVATRNTADFADCGVEVVDPFLRSSK